MTLTTTQKIIKVGSSFAITIPAKEAKRAGWKEGDYLNATLTLDNQPSQHQLEVVEIAQKLIARHKSALVHLSQR